MNGHFTWRRFRRFRGLARKRRISLTRKVAGVFVLFAALLLATVGFLAYYSGHEALQEATIADLRSAAVEKEVALDRWMEERQRDVLSLAAMPDVVDDLAILVSAKTGSAAAERARIRLLKGFLPFTGHKLSSLFVLAPDDGRIVVSTNPRDEGTFKENRPYFINGKEGPYMQGPYNSLDFGGPAITIAGPVKSSAGRLVGVLAGRLNLDDMGAVINPKTDAHQTNDSYLVNRSRLFVTQPRFISNPVILRRGIHTEAAKRGLRGESGHILASDYRNVPTIAVYRWLPRQQLCLVVERDQQEAFAPSRAFGKVITLIALLALVVASMVAVGLARTITRPVLALQAGAARFGRGETDVRLPETPYDELGDLACEFNRMAAAISEREAALHRWAHIFKYAGWGIAVSDSDGEKLDLMNPAFARMYGYTVEELSGRPILEICTPEAQADLREHLRLACTRGHHTFESVHVRKEGSVFPVLADVTAVKDEQGTALYLALNVRDITERRRAEEEKRRSQERTERLAEEMAIIAEIGRLVGSTLDISQVFERVDAEVHKLIPYDRLLVNLRKNGAEFVVVYASGADNPRRRLGEPYPCKGTTTGVVLTTRTGVLIQPAEAEEIQDLYPNLYATTVKDGLRSTMSVPLISLDEAIGCLTFRSRTPQAYTERDLHLAERIGMQIAGAIVNAQLFNDLSKVEKSLRENEETMRYIIKHDPNAIAVFDLDLRYVAVSDRYLQDYNVKEADITGKYHYEVFQEMPQEWKDVHQRCLAGAIERNDDDYFERPDGSITYNRWECRPWYRADGEIGGIITYTEVTTERKRAEEEKRSLEMRLNRAEKMEALGQLAGGVAHDLNNVLGVSTIYSELLQEKIPAESPLRKYVDNILTSTQKGAAIIEDLLTLARRGVKASDVMNLNSIVSNFLKTPEFEKMQALHPRVAFRTECQTELLNIKGSPLHLEKTLMNLVSNAVEAISGEGEVTIRTENRYLDKPVGGYDEVKEGDYAVLTVSDTGIGIPAESIGKIFEPFYTKKAMGRSGTGLGLAIVWGTVKDHRGYIDLHTEVGGGTAFTLYFPVTREEVAAQEQKTPVERYMGKGESVLVVDDVPEQRDVAARLLTRLGYRVHVVTSGEEAVAYLAENRADILILDMIMPPGIDGLETYRRVMEVNPKQKAIIVSGFAETERVRKAQEMGAGAYVRKPYMMERIGLAIRGELARP